MIGIFDSGSGGLSVLKALRKEMPSADIIYFGDTKNAPYGEKSREELSALTVSAIERLVARGATSIISACNSVSASLSLSLLDTFKFPPDHLIEMVGPTVALFRGGNRRVTVAATNATIRSGIYQNAFRMIGTEANMLAIPHLAPAIENGATEAELDGVVKDAVHGLSPDDTSALVLACTHYPLVLEIFRRHTNPAITIVDPSEAVAERAASRLWPREAGDGTLSFIISKDSPAFRGRVQTMFPESIGAIEVV